jgi:hypothetical protein
MVDALRNVARQPLAVRKEADIEAVTNGERRLVRCYVKPKSGEHRRHWKPGYLKVSADRLRWRGSSRRWQPFDLGAGQWTTRLRNATRDDRVYRSFGVIECERGAANLSLAVPRPDVDLCTCVLMKKLS